MKMNNKEFAIYLCGRLFEIKNNKKITSSHLDPIIRLLENQIWRINREIEDEEIDWDYINNYHELGSGDEYWAEKRSEFLNRIDGDTDLDQQGDIW